ncbi:MAG: signal peptidase I [Treponema sp.]|jgi:signal peptidase I|nr:signal peptidase I [Treponema sp.]
MASQSGFLDRLQEITEACLTYRKKIRRIKKEKLRGKNPILDWIEAFLWAAGVVLLINQYLFQAYQIPSGSMIDTLLIKDRIFVNKLIYGPELLPGTAKLPSPIRPQRNDIIIFENPSYISRGPAFDVAQRIIYMLTLSLVDIDRDELGEPKAHFLIKRAVGVGGDRFISHGGELSILFAGEDRWVSEREYAAARNMNHHISRLVDAEHYPALEAAGKISGYNALGLSPPAYLAAAGEQGRYTDFIAREQKRLEVMRMANPHDSRYGMDLARFNLGWYVPESRVFPLGDNRDNSRDGRYFGPVRVSKVLGSGALIYWPLGRIGPIR